ncbi:MAG TPA: DUF1616 domain-containing protein [Streptosporangiaceae bacterium]|nr:DUF1616 domain-containing protein [Streptosporangiaceae bacterium]
MNMRRQAPLVGTILAASLTMITPLTAEVPRVTLGILIVFFLPGFAATCAVLDARRLSLNDRLLASLGISLGTTVCAAVLLAALPIGLTRASLSVALGGVTVIVALYALFRMRSAMASTMNTEIGPTGPGPIIEED